MILNLVPLTALLLFVLLSFLFILNKNGKNSITLLSYGAGFGSASSFYWGLIDAPSYILNLQWFSSNLPSFSLSFYLDLPSILFTGVALFVTWSIIEFSHYYMDSDPNNQKFFNTLIFFLFFMLILVSANSLFLLFIGWEGVGILSFILIGWWFTRADANSAALQAIIYNRIGDSGMILFLAFSIILLNSWDLNSLLTLINQTPLTSWALLGIIIAAAGKSAQFSLHPWLPSAMEGPTPVSALLHSSTMVVAGVFLLFRCHPLLNSVTWALPIVSVLGALTALFAASAALAQYDIKKVVAYSTTSQLGLMVVALGLNIPSLALFHICTHAFFKALLFLCSGSIIHSLNNEQDIRKMSNSSEVLPFTTSCIVIGSLALCGLPFLAGYYSKDLILEAGQGSISNSISIILSLVATLMTAVYSFRIIFYVGFNKHNTETIVPSSEQNLNLILPLIRLIGGVFISGWIFSLFFFNLSPLILPWSNKVLPLFLTLAAAVYIFNQTPLLPTLNKNIIPLAFFLSSNWFFVQLSHGTLFLSSLTNSIKGVLRGLDHGWTSQLGPKGSSHTIINVSNVIQKSLTGITSHYLSYALLLFIAGILLLLF
uniref:NADH-ubiquinone oxidoreductase chain 5 n=1 Tax=Ophionereis sp. TaxID=3135531 RepID=A0AAU6PXF4_9ECHI